MWTFLFTEAYDCDFIVYTASHALFCPVSRTIAIMIMIIIITAMGLSEMAALICTISEMHYD